MVVGISISQGIAICVLSLLFTNKDSEYYKISFKNRTSLPGFSPPKKRVKSSSDIFTF